MDNYAKVKAWRAKNPEKVLEQARRYRLRHPETNRRAKRKYREAQLERIRSMDAAAARRRRAADPEGQRRRMRAFLERKLARQESQAGRPRPTLCELCGEFHQRIVFDHCHMSGRFRGWICDRCNKILGLVRDSPDLLRKLAAYVEANRILGK